MRLTVLMLVGLLALDISRGERIGAAEAATAADTTCAVTPVHYSAYRGVGRRGTPHTPWIAATPRSSHIIGFLFYNPPHVTGKAAYPHINGNGPANGSSDKILWYVAKGVGMPTLKISGRNLSMPDMMRSVVSEVTPANNYPSNLDVASAGCWHLTLHTGTLTGHVILDVLP